MYNVFELIFGVTLIGILIMCLVVMLSLGIMYPLVVLPILGGVVYAWKKL